MAEETPLDRVLKAFRAHHTPEDAARIEASIWPLKTDDAFEKEVEDLLRECVKAAHSYMRMKDRRLAQELLIDAMFRVSEWRRLMDETLLAEESVDINKPPRGTVQAFRR